MAIRRCVVSTLSYHRLYKPNLVTGNIQTHRDYVNAKMAGNLYNRISESEAYGYSEIDQADTRAYT